MYRTRLGVVLVVVSAVALTTGWVAAQQAARPGLGDYYSEMQWTMVDSGYAPDNIMFTVGEDLNGDRHQDLVVLGAADMNRSGYNAPQPGRVFLGDGDGQFLPAPRDLFPVDTLWTVLPRKVLFADFNADGRPDMFLSSTGWDAFPWPGEQNRLYTVARWRRVA